MSRLSISKVAVGCASLLVLSGVTSALDLLTAVPEHRPDYLAPTVAGLLASHPEVRAEGASAGCGAWSATADSSALTLSSRDEPASGAGDDLDALRALCVAAWAAAGDGAITDWTFDSEGSPAEEMLRSLGLG